MMLCFISIYIYSILFGFTESRCTFSDWDWSDDWPRGPYALPMSNTGCPYILRYSGWYPGYINLTFATSVTAFNKCTGSNNNASLTENQLNILGPSDEYNLQINFCFKSDRDQDNDNLWPDGNYSIYGTKDGCPTGFKETKLTMCLPPILQRNSDGCLPYYNVESGSEATYVELMLCTRNGELKTENKTRTYVVVKDQESDCPWSTVEMSFVYPVFSVDRQFVNFCIHVEDWNDLSTEFNVRLYRSSMCQRDMGMYDTHIEDYQLSASSSSVDTAPTMARPQSRGWCAGRHDMSPWFRVDLLVATRFEGIIIYNWVEIVPGSQDSNEYGLSVVLGGSSSFSVMYGTSDLDLQFYQEEDFYVDLSRPFTEPQTFRFLSEEMVNARVVKLYPKIHGQSLQVCLKFELLGCKKTGIHSLDCNDNSTKEIFNTTSAYIPANNDFVLIANHTLDECKTKCMTSECIAFEHSSTRDLCKQYIVTTKMYTYVNKSDEFDYMGTVNCFNENNFGYEAFDEMLIRQIDPFPGHIYTSVGYPLEYTNTFIEFQSSRSIKFVFTDISLRPTVNLNSNPDDICSDIIVIQQGLGYNIYYNKRVNSTSNGLRFVDITPGGYFTSSSIYLSICPFDGGKQVKGFRVHILQNDKNMCTAGGRLCGGYQELALISPSFLGVPMETSSVFSWDIHPMSFPENVFPIDIIYFTFDDFDISCQLDARVTITDSVDRIGIEYCNTNRPVGKTIYNTYNIIITMRTSFVQENVFIEGFSASVYTSENNPEGIYYPSISSFFTECSAIVQKCYGFSILAKTISWSEATEMCTSRGGMLVAIRTLDEYLFVNKFFYKKWIEERRWGFMNDPYIHIGLSRFTVQDGESLQEAWTDGMPIVFTAWEKNEPNLPFQKRCTRMNVVKYHTQRSWSSESCQDATASNVICEIAHSIHFTNITDGRLYESGHDDNGHSGFYEGGYDDNGHSGFLFHCPSGEYVSKLAVCNTMTECSDGADEANCTVVVCNSYQFMCGSGKCIHISAVCDFIEDCEDASDEYCDHPFCLPDVEFACSNGQCIPNSERCDSVPQCIDKSDELICDVCNTEVAFPCGGTCIPVRLVCDDTVDCNDGSDEIGCHDLIYKTCDDVLHAGLTKSGIYKMVSDHYMDCYFDFYNNMTTMKYPNIDWRVVAEDLEYQTNSVEFFKFAINDNYSCYQNFTPILRPVEADIAILDNLTHNAFEEAVLKIDTSTSEFGFGMKNHSLFEVFINDNNSYSLSLRIHTSFDHKRFRIPMGPIVCTKVLSLPDDVYPCGINLPPVSSARKCVYDLDQNEKIMGCRNFAHLQNCSGAKCGLGYVKCPNSYCIPASYVCNDRIDCIDGHDEINCYCVDESSRIYMIEFGRAGTAFSLAGRWVGKERDVVVIQIDMTDDMETLTYYVYNMKLPILHEPTVYQNVTINELRFQFLPVDQVGIIFIDTPPELEDTENDISKDILNTYFESDKYFYRLVIDSSLTTPSHIIEIGSEGGNTQMSEVRVQTISLLLANGPLYFSELCKGSTNVFCKNGHVCTSSRICIPLDQVCDNHADCPYGDDERVCGFKCPEKCLCDGLAFNCLNESFTWDELYNVESVIRSLNVSGNSNLGDTPLIRKLSFSYLVSLYAQNIDLTSLTHVSTGLLRYSPNIQILDLRYNKLRKLNKGAFDYSKHLIHLFLEGNDFLTTIEPATFDSLQLESLSLRRCGLIVIQPNTFSGLDLAYLDLSENNIQEIQDSAFEHLQTRTLDISNNPIQSFGKQMFFGVDSMTFLKTPSFKYCCFRPDYLPEEHCEPQKNEFSSCDDLIRNTSLQALLWIIGIFAVIGNISSLVYRLVFDRKRLKIGYGIFVTNLAVADLLMGLYLLILAVADSLYRSRYILMDEYWRSSGWCQFCGVISTMSSEASVLFICLITFDRILVIKFPFGTVKFTTKYAHATSAVCWIVVFLISIFPVLHQSYFEDRFYTSRAVCVALPLTRDRPPGWLYSILIFIGFNFIAFILIAVGQCLIFYEIRKASKVKKKMNITRSKDLTVARNLLLVVSTDFLCWFPIGCMGALALTDYPIPGEVYAWTVVLILPINSALNPFMYTYSVMIGRRKLNPSVDEQSRQANSSEAILTLEKLLPGYIDRMKSLCCLATVQNIIDSRRLTTYQTFHIAIRLAKYLESLHSIDLVAADIHAKLILTEVDKNGNMKIGGVHFMDVPIASSKTSDKARNMHKMAILLRNLLK